jgi:hypothetical protein
MFPVRYELNSYIVFRKRLVSKRLSKAVLNVSGIERFVFLIEMVLKGSTFWDAIPWSENITTSDSSSTLKVEAARSFETTVNFERVARPYIPQHKKH